jgi:hypothetical protein
MKIVSDNYEDTIKNIVRECRSSNNDTFYSSHFNVDNIQYLTDIRDKNRMNNLFGYIEYNYDNYHKDDYRNKAHYMLKAVTIIRKYGAYLENLSNNSLSLLISEIPFEVDNDRSEDRFKALISDELMSEVRLLSNRFLPCDTISTFLQHYDKRKFRQKTESFLNQFRLSEIDKMETNKNKYFAKSLSASEYAEYLNNEELYKDAIR